MLTLIDIDAEKYILITLKISCSTIYSISKIIRSPSKSQQHFQINKSLAVLQYILRMTQYNNKHYIFRKI